MSESDKKFGISDLEILSYSKALISCFTLFFPEKFREELLACTSKFFREDSQIRDGYISDFDPSLPYKTVESMSGFYYYIDKRPLEGLGLYKIFRILYSNDIEDDTRATLIPTFRALRLSLKNKYGDTSLLDRYIEDSYELFCEVTSHSGQRTDFLSDKVCGSLVEPHLPDEANATQNYLQNLIPENGELLLCEKIELDWSHYRLNSVEARKTFVSELYKRLRDFSNNPHKKKYYGIGVLDFPDDINALPTIEQLKAEPQADDNNIIRYYPVQCNLENFINMFEGITDIPPYRTEMCKKPDSTSGTSYCLSCLITAMGCPKGNRNIVADGFQNLIASPDGSLIKADYLRTPSKERHPELVSEYEKIVRDAISRANGIFIPKYNI